MPRNERYTEAEVGAALRSTKGLIAMAARKLGCDPKTVRDYMKKYQSVRDAAEFASEETLDVGEGRLLALVNDPSHRDHFKSVRFLLRTKGRHRGYGDRLDVTTNDQPITEIKIVAPAADDTDGPHADD